MKKETKSKLFNIFIKYQLLFVILVAIDQITKRLAVKYLASKTVKIFDWLLLDLSINSGVAFSFLNGAPQWISALVSIAATLIIEYFLIFKKEEDKVFNILLLILAAGAFGNGIDRWLAVFTNITGYTGVIDFIYPTFFANFNFADICVTLSCIAIVLYIFFSKDDSEPSFNEMRKAKKELERLKEEENK